MPRPSASQRFSTMLRLRHVNPRRRRLVLLVLRGVLLLAAVAGLVGLSLALIGDVPRGADGSLDFNAIMGAATGTVWAPVIVLAVFILLNFAGMPQFLLVGGTVIVFGAWLGFFYAWAATLASAAVGFWLGHLFGGELLRRFAGDRANEFSQRLGRHGIFASSVVRFVPAGPAIMVNMALGVSHVNFVKFLIGTALGAAPKVFVVAIVGNNLVAFLKDGGIAVVVSTAGFLVAWFAFMVFAKRYFNRWRAAHAPEMIAPEKAGAATQEGGGRSESASWPGEDVPTAAKTGL